MKKILLIIICLFTFSSCSDKPLKNEFDIVTHEVDMTLYNGVSSENCFLGTTYDELERCINEKGSGIFYLGYTECQFCQGIAKYMNEVGLDQGVKIYYIDAFSSEYPFVKGGNLQKYIELLNDYLPIEDGKKVAKTPHVFTVINGEIVESQISFSPFDIDNPSESQIKKLKQRYKQMFKPFVDYFS